jgi:hypothetical protein
MIVLYRFFYFCVRVLLYPRMAILLQYNIGVVVVGCHTAMNPQSRASQVLFRIV